MVKQLLLLAFITVAWEAMGQEAQCVPERAAMVETIRAYARIEASVVGPRGVSERVLEAPKRSSEMSDRRLNYKVPFLAAVQVSPLNSAQARQISIFTCGP